MVTVWLFICWFVYLPMDSPVCLFTGNCASHFGPTGGFRYWGCSNVTPTGLIGSGSDQGFPYMFWQYAFNSHEWQALKSLTMMIKPTL